MKEASLALVLTKSAQDCPINGLNEELKNISGIKAQINPKIKTTIWGINRIIHDTFNGFDSICNTSLWF
jgi:hypothetical protein